MTFPDWSDEQIVTLVESMLPSDLWRPARVREALRAAGIVPNGARWRPIADAPVDAVLGDEILGWWAPNKGADVAFMGRAAGGRLDWRGRAYHGRPTHWQPLPAPPTTEPT
jgi:hypothetical protein